MRQVRVKSTACTYALDSLTLPGGEPVLVDPDAVPALLALPGVVLLDPLPEA